MHTEEEERALLDAIDLVVARVVAEPQVRFPLLRELEALRERVERELRSTALRTPPGLRHSA